MDFFELIGSRKSVRSFDERAVEEEKLRKILDAVSTAPSAGNLKAYEITVVRELVQKKLLVAAATGQSFVAEAPVVLVFSADPSKSASRYAQRGQLYAVQDATIACAYAQLAATGLGLENCWVGALDEGAVAEAVDLKKGLRPIALLPIGYERQ